jgi:predicted TIM-barrel fold metal-dependent hydrolase
MTIFDAHMHPFPNVMATRPSDRPEHNLHLVDNVRTVFAENGIAGGLMLGKSGPQLDAMTAEIPNLFGLYWTAPRAPNPELAFPDYIEETAHWLEHPKIVGIKLHPLADGYDPSSWMLDPLAAELVVALLFHSGHEFGSLPWLIEDAAKRHPKAKFVMAHMGLHTYEYVEGAIECCERTPNLYVDVAAMPFVWKIKEAMQRFGEERVMYGSDAPFFAPGVEIEKIRLAGLSDDQLELIFHRNAMDIYFNAGNRPTL